jgi:hypothetical protein
MVNAHDSFAGGTSRTKAEDVRRRSYSKAGFLAPERRCLKNELNIAGFTSVCTGILHEHFVGIGLFRRMDAG